MKTPEEIKEYLEKSDFYEQFKANVRGPIRDDILNGKSGINTFTKAFDWGVTNEGYSFWSGKNFMFQTWFDHVDEPVKTTGKKNDIIDDKLPWNLLPLIDLEEVVKVFHAGAKKYGPNNWQNLDNGYERYKAALFRHLLEVEKGNKIDSDTGCYHIAQVVWNALAMLHFKLKEYRNDKDS